ncbi:Cation efflux system protein CusA [Herminiimonas arsenicoxydans]|uniref:Cation efflux system protein CusA n=1 Tax=Herminiimonas arsenicoxydans TaxID=204773 RepID=A4GA13_HERAR|nr:Cation efflux system protein CusA [Herminiimonas arsenicoxydans]
MIARTIAWSIRNRLVVLVASLILIVVGIESLSRLALDALPDLSDVQVIVKTDFPGQAPQFVEDQVTYPLAASLLSVPGTKAVRGFSMFGESYVYVIFKDGTDIYWARSRILENLSQVAGRLPAGAQPTLGPDASGVGWVYEYALLDRSGHTPVEKLRALQDFYLKLELQSVPGVAEVASLGGMARQFQVDVDPVRLAAHNLDLGQVAQAVKNSNQSSGGAAFEMARAEYLVRSNGYLRNTADFDDIPVMTDSAGNVIRLKQVANLTVGPQPRRGIAELDGKGEVTGGIVVMRHGENALTTIRGVKARLEELKKGLPPGVEIVPTYDRSGLIERAVHTLRDKLLEESLAVALICGIFLFHFRSSLVAIVTLPIGILVALWIMRLQGVSANIMSLGGIAIAVGAMVDAAIVMIENMHRHLEKIPLAQQREDVWDIVRQSATEVGPALFFSLLVITLSFLPVFTLTGQEARLFTPLAYTKTYAMAAAAMLAITLTPVLMGYAIRGRIPPESANPLNRVLKRIYQPALHAALRHPKMILLAAAVSLLTLAFPLSQLGSEFMPPLDEGDLLYMPTTLPGISADEAADILRRTDQLIAAMPEVERVFGKAGRAETATDPAPLSMLETTIILKPRSEWPAGSTKQGLIEKLDQTVRLAGLTNSWGYPIKTRIDMLSTGIRTPLGIKISGPDMAQLERLSIDIESALRAVPGTRSVFAERIGAGRYVDIDIDRQQAARYGLSVADIQSVTESAVGGQTIGTIIDGRERFPITLRYSRSDRDSPRALGDIRIKAPSGALIMLRDVARVHVSDGPTEIKSENARPVAYVFIDLATPDAGRYLEAAQQVLDQKIKFGTGYTMSWQGQYLNYQNGKPRLWSAVALTLLLVMALLFLHFRNAVKVGLVLLCLPFSLIGGLWFIYLLGYQLSVAVIIGLIALSGVAAEFGIVMLLYLDQALAALKEQKARIDDADLLSAIISGALLRLRPKAMTVAVILGGLLPVMFSDEAGADVMKRIAAPLIGGMISAPLFSLIVIPAFYLLIHRYQIQRRQIQGHQIERRRMQRRQKQRSQTHDTQVEPVPAAE